MNALASTRNVVYDFNALAAAGAGVDSPKHVRRTSATNGVFLRLKFIYGGVRGETERSAGVLTGRSVNPAHNRHHLFDSSDGGLQVQLGVTP